jgi:hypothetical protein
MDAQAEQIKRAAPVWIWDGHWWPAVVADATRGGELLIVRLENGVTVPVRRARLQLATRRSTVATSLDFLGARVSRVRYQRAGIVASRAKAAP